MRLSDCEKLALWRRRLKLTQTEAAEWFNVGRYTFSTWELGKFKDTDKIVEVHGMLPFEKCFIHRRRSGLLQREVALAMGVTRHWVHEMESGAGSCKRLVEYWRTNA